jgi:hypothetical protein
MIIYKSMICALPIAFVLYFYPASANEPSLKQPQENAPKIEDKPIQTKPSKKPPAQTISLNYQINDQPISTVETTEDKPFSVLSEIFSKTIDTASKIPNQIVNTIVHLPYPEDMQKSFKEKLPDFVLQTTVEVPNGKANTNFSLAPFRGEIIDKNNKKGLLEWAGLNGSANYISVLKSLNANLTMPHFLIKIDNEFDILMEKFSLSSSFNEYYEPLHFNLELPVIKISSHEKKDAFTFSLSNLKAKFVSDDQEILEGLRLGHGSLGISEIAFNNNEDALVAKEIYGEKIIQINDPTTKKFVNVSSKLNMNHLTLPSSFANGVTNVSFELQTDLNNLDAQVLADIKKTLRQLQTQEFTPEMMGVMLMGDLIKALPKVVKGSPELNINHFAIKTNQGELIGSFSVGIDGKKPFSMEKVEMLKMAIKAQSSVRISKGMLRKILVLTLKESKQQPQTTAQNDENKMEGEKPKKKQITQSIKPEKMADEQIKQFIAQKFLVEEAQHYKLDAEFKGGKLFLNDQEIPLPF